MKKTILNLILTGLLGLAAFGQTKQPIKNGILQSDLDAAGYKINAANLINYAGAGLSWNFVTNQFDITGGGGTGGEAGGSPNDYQWNSAGFSQGNSGVTYDGVIPITITKATGASHSAGVRIVNPNTASPSSGLQQDPAGIYFKGSNYLSGTPPLVEDVEWRIIPITVDYNNTSGAAAGHPYSYLAFQCRYGGGSWDTGHPWATIDSVGALLSSGGDRLVFGAVVMAADTVQVGDSTRSVNAAITQGNASGGFAMGGYSCVFWNAPGGTYGNDWNAHPDGDLSLAREAPGMLQVNNGWFAGQTSGYGLAGKYAGAHMKTLWLDPDTVANLPASPSIGRQAVVNDGAPGLAWGATVTAGGSSKYLVWYNGTNWTVMGK